jgi:hypothetical protein
MYLYLLEQHLHPGAPSLSLFVLLLLASAPRLLLLLLGVIVTPRMGVLGVIITPALLLLLW